MKKATIAKLEAWLVKKPDYYDSPDPELYDFVKTMVENKDSIELEELTFYMQKCQPKWAERKIVPLAELRKRDIWQLTGLYKYMKDGMFDRPDDYDVGYMIP